MTTTPTLEKTGRALISPAVFDRLTNRVVTDHLIDLPRAERIVDQALGFVATCAANPGAALSPSVEVDMGWHAFLVHTRAYADFCTEVAGRFIHHEPTDETDAKSGGIMRTVKAMRAAGFAVDDELWPNMADCTQCHQGCTDSN
ncbi:hypothetical protein Lfu02_55370 [Longispora fulva]|uniref:Uncharacterized protein n=1 Tax=Longispora fulva TaxID=619741 RepID=A0A8J7GIZ4_9ACTN|nr:hypothetical protein [Longispora fulva]MBG6137480.1 hypothetical protein [Longispora fulva]GIG61165.1 hypothetical protein Lfu02_55370 [Longispora fulva]